MKKLILSILLILALASPSWAAINAGTVWEVRTTGSQLWGGGYVSLVANTSTDYSQYDSCKASWVAASAGGCTANASCIGAANPVACCTGAGTGTCQPNATSNVTNDLASTQASSWLTLTSASGGFTNLQQGNIIQITAGTNFLPGWYEITAYTSANTVTVDRACGSVGNASAGTGYLGGAFKIGGTLDHDWCISIVAGNTVYIQSGTYTAGEAMNEGSSGGLGYGTFLLPITWFGYINSRTTTAYGNDRPLIDFGTSYFWWPGSYHLIKNLRITGSENSDILEIKDGTVVENCKITNTGTGSSAMAVLFQSGANSRLINCEISSGGTSALIGAIDLNAATWVVIYGCYIYNSKNAIHLNVTDSVQILNNIIVNSSAYGVLQSTNSDAAVRIIGNTFYGASTPAGTAVWLQQGTNPHGAVVMNNIFYGWSTGILLPAAQIKTHYFDYNDYYNTTTPYTYSWAAGAHDQALDPQFVSPSTGDFRIGLNLKAKGFPQFGANVGVSASGIGYVDIGAVQRIEGDIGNTLQYYYGRGWRCFN